jgi:hypothetical protein
MACGTARPVPTPPPPSPPSARAAPPVRSRVQLTVIPAESDAYPRAAKALSASLTGAAIDGVDDTEVSKVSLEVAQLAIECVDPTDACYAAIGRSMAANRLLFARIDPGASRRQLKVTVMLYDVDTGAARRKIAKIFASEAAAVAGADALVAEATR